MVMADDRIIITRVMDALYQMFPDCVKNWIINKWPYGNGLYD